MLGTVLGTVVRLGGGGCRGPRVGGGGISGSGDACVTSFGGSVDAHANWQAVAGGACCYTRHRTSQLPTLPYLSAVLLTALMACHGHQVDLARALSEHPKTRYAESQAQLLSASDDNGKMSCVLNKFKVDTQQPHASEGGGLGFEACVASTRARTFSECAKGLGAAPVPSEIGPIDGIGSSSTKELATHERLQGQLLERLQKQQGLHEADVRETNTRLELIENSISQLLQAHTTLLDAVGRFQRQQAVVSLILAPADTPPPAGGVLNALN